MVSAKRQSDFWENFGTALAALHKNTQDNFGLDEDNYIGSLSQSNRCHSDWTDFFIAERLEPQIALARNNRKISQSHTRQFEKLYKKFPEIFPEEKPALVHGDLWNGNFITGKDGYACLVDPAVHYGNREAELSFTKLFGGFDPGFYQAYQQAFPLEKCFAQRVDIYNLYPLMVHVNLFDGGYAASVESILRKF
jgi:fructosamine-3-kinase